MWTSILMSTALTVVIFFRLFISRLRFRHKKKTRDVRSTHWEYSPMKKMIHDKRISLPAMFVDLDLVDYNIKRLVNMAKHSGKTIRIATKSVRCPKLLQRIIEKGNGTIKGLMCYSVQEAAFLINEYHFDDVYIPYPTVQLSDLDTAFDLTQKGKWLCLTVASVEHVKLINECLGQIKTEKSKGNAKKVRVAVDIDMSFYLGPIQLGCHRSKCKTVQQFAAITDEIASSEHLQFCGIMGYEAHVAGLPDKTPHGQYPNFLVRFLKGMFFKKVVQFRRDCAKYCLENKLDVEFFNGAGSGNLREACEQDDVITEVTAGSAFLQAKIFDYFVENQCKGAFCFALQATRVNDDYICCQSGGFIASGAVSRDKLPVPYANPLKLVPYNDEGFGEVQTPLQIKGQNAKVDGTISLGDPVFFRPAKSGEIAEHFDEYFLKKDYDIIETVKTHRGHGKVFY